MRTLRKTRNLEVVQTLLGHTDIKATVTFYTEALAEDLREAMEKTWVRARERKPQEKPRRSEKP